MASNRRFDIKPLTNPLVDGVSQCFHTVDTEMYVLLSPEHLANPLNGIKQQHLDPLLMTYHAKLGGVVVGVDGIEILNLNQYDDSLLLPVEGTTPFTFFWVKARLLVWKPQVGDVLEGHIYMQTASHLGLLVHDTFNALIKKNNLPMLWQFRASDVDLDSRYGSWVDELETLVEGTLKFTVKTIHSSGRVVSLEGTLVDPTAEPDAQPVGYHKTFDDEEAPVAETAATPDTDATAGYPKNEDDDDDDDEVPRYQQDDDDDEDASD